MDLSNCDTTQLATIEGYTFGAYFDFLEARRRYFYKQNALAEERKAKAKLLKR